LGKHSYRSKRNKRPLQTSPKQEQQLQQSQQNGFSIIYHNNSIHLCECFTTAKKPITVTNSMKLSDFEKPPVAKVIKKFPTFMEPEGILPSSQEPAADPYLEPAESSPYHPTLSV
jgi:hypothetical protein